MNHKENIINSNPSLFGLHFKGYENGKVVFSEILPYYLPRVEQDVKTFQERQEAIKNRTSIACGDYVIRKSGETERITVDNYSDSIQVGSHKNGGYYINSNGRCGYSGGCGDVIKIENLKPTDKYMEGRCWIFHNLSSGANRGVSSYLEFKVWEEK